MIDFLIALIFANFVLAVVFVYPTLIGSVILLIGILSFIFIRDKIE